VGRILKITYFLENYIGNNDWMTGNVISEADTLMYVTIKEENHMPYRELVHTTECRELYIVEVSHKPRSS
jgi:hypothetical protein